MNRFANADPKPDPLCPVATVYDAMGDRPAAVPAVATKPGVLAVMDAVANGIHSPNEGEIQIAHHQLHDFIEARATVERLAEALETYLGRRNIGISIAAARIEAEAALAAFRGEA